MEHISAQQRNLRVLDTLAKLGSEKVQDDTPVTYKEIKTIIKSKLAELWDQKHPQFNKNDPYYLLNRPDQVIIFRLRTGHNRLKHHLFNKLKIGDTDKCSCNSALETTEHILQSCPLLRDLRTKTWPEPRDLSQKLYGNLGDLQRTATFMKETGLSI